MSLRDPFTSKFYYKELYRPEIIMEESTAAIDSSAALFATNVAAGSKENVILDNPISDLTNIHTERLLNRSNSVYLPGDASKSKVVHIRSRLLKDAAYGGEENGRPGGPTKTRDSAAAATPSGHPNVTLPPIRFADSLTTKVVNLSYHQANAHSRDQRLQKSLDLTQPPRTDQPQPNDTDQPLVNVANLQLFNDQKTNENRRMIEQILSYRIPLWNKRSKTNVDAFVTPEKGAHNKAARATKDAAEAKACGAAACGAAGLAKPAACGSGTGGAAPACGAAVGKEEGKTGNGGAKTSTERSGESTGGAADSGARPRHSVQRLKQDYRDQAPSAGPNDASPGDSVAAAEVPSPSARPASGNTWHTWRDVNDSYAYSDVQKYIEENELMTPDKLRSIQKWVYDVNKHFLPSQGSYRSK